MKDTAQQKNFSALVIGASGGIGAALSHALKNDPACKELITLSRSADGFDLTDENNVAAAADKLRNSDASFNLIINASGALEVDGAAPEKAFREVDATVMQRAFSINSVGAALALKHFMPLMARKERTVFATLSARIGSIGDNRLGGWISYRASKAALNQIVRCAAIEYARTNKDSVIVSLHPGTIKTPLTEKYAKGRYTADPAEAAVNLLNVIHSLTPEQSGGFFDYAGKEIVW